nr:hypothetical protein BJQ95_02454 [Cryobacterium sp. SO1]
MSAPITASPSSARSPRCRWSVAACENDVPDSTPAAEWMPTVMSPTALLPTRSARRIDVAMQAVTMRPMLRIDVVPELKYVVKVALSTPSVMKAMARPE